MSHWETEIATFLTELSGVQQRTLSLLQRKGEMLARSDRTGLARLAAEEKETMDALQEFLDRREKMLQIAKAEGLPNDSIESLARELDRGTSEKPLQEQCRESIRRTRILQHQSLTNWVLTQRTLIHLSQMLEMIATKGRPRSTYNRNHTKSPGKPTGGALVDLGG